MKKIQHILVTIAFLALTVCGCKNNLFSKKSSVNYLNSDVKEAFKSPKQIIMNIEGMMCAVGCAATIEKNLNKTNGIKFAKVDFETKKAVLTFDSNLLTTNNIAQIVLNTGNDYFVTNLELID